MMRRPIMSTAEASSMLDAYSRLTSKRASSSPVYEATCGKHTVQLGHRVCKEDSGRWVRLLQARE